MVTTLGPLLPVTIVVSVISGGAEVIVFPALLVVVTYTVDLSVVVAVFCT